MKTVVGLFASNAKAESVKEVLIEAGYSSQNIRVMANDGMSAQGTTSTSSSSLGTGMGTTGSTTPGMGSAGTSGTGTSIGDRISNFFSSLSGGNDQENSYYSQGVSQGGAMLAATVQDSEADDVADLLEQHGARNVDESNAKTGSAGMAAASTRSMTETTGQTAIPIVEEELVVGKRQVGRGGVRVYSHVTERPVEADVTLREEHVRVERRPVDRAATAADFTGNEGVIELTETAEEAVVGKKSRVVEEVLVGKESSERTESIRDTVRRTEVDVEQIPATETRTTTQTSTTSTGKKI